MGGHRRKCIQRYATHILFFACEVLAFCLIAEFLKRTFNITSATPTPGCQNKDSRQLAQYENEWVNEIRIKNQQIVHLKLKANTNYIFFQIDENMQVK